MSNNNVALTKCFYCGKDGNILLSKNFSDISEMHQKVVDISPCVQCAQYMEQGIILLAIDNDKSEGSWNIPTGKNFIPNPYRTGGFFVLKDSALEKILPDGMFTFAKKNRFMFIEDEACRQMGLYDHAKESETT